ncbi:hypothetical protein CSPAE12_11942 [Colletotrichum incanum]|nr:hypothetical protein CSPAE12_11942 [Colletotrichum incanum]
MIDHTSPSSTPSSPSSRDGQPQNYLRIPGLVFDDVPALIPQEHSAALKFLQPSDFDLGMSYGEYYALLEPFDRVAHKLVDVFDYCIQVLRQSTDFVALPSQPTGTYSSSQHFVSVLSAFWGGFYDQVLDHLGHSVEKVVGFGELFGVGQ